MKIAIVSPSPVPFTIGGAENLAWGLCEAINKYTKHQAELIKLPSKEFEFWDLVENYYQFYNLDLSHFDLVISTKYPAWMVKHDNCMVYMLHTLRGLYDTYPQMDLKEEVDPSCPAVNAILSYMEKHRNYHDLKIFFEKLFKLKNDTSIPASFFAFPGPFIRKIVHYMDYCALSQDGMHKWAAISNTVKNRKDYFPEYANVDVVYPPTILKECNTGDSKHIFFCSRLDAPKRIDMLVRAMKLVKSDVKLYIAGTGPERDKLLELAKDDPRIKFLGFVSDQEVEEYYANAICIPYFPFDEDYGYITIEAMLHKKPVITTTDSGGPNEFVEDGVNGFVVPFEEKAIAEKIDYLAQHIDEAKEMGVKAYDKVKDITWERAVASLLDMEGERLHDKKIVVTNTFAITPVMGGGQARVFNLYKSAAQKCDVEIVAYTVSDEKPRKRKIARGLTETVIPKSAAHQAEENKLTDLFQKPVTDIAMPFLGEMTPEYTAKLEEATKDADLVILSHPYTYNQYLKHASHLPFAYEAQDIEYLLKKEMFKDVDHPKAQELLENLHKIEKECCEKSQFIMTCSQEDKDKLVELYGITPDKILVVPNGVDCKATTYTDVDTRLLNKKEAGLEKEKIGIFMGSWHGPNLESGEIIVETAKSCPDTKFFIIGSMCSYFLHRPLPSNVALLGMVSDDEKTRIFSIADFALNPMYSGSGTNLKMFDYMSAGLPIITSMFGTRGIENKDLFILAEKESLAETINHFDLASMRDKVEASRKYAEDIFDWKVIVKPLLEKLP